MTYSSDFASVNGTRLHYLRWRSAGRPVVILHGNSHCGGVYAPLGEQLAGDFDVVAVDLRGHGLSEKPDAYAWSLLRDDVVALIDSLDLRDVVLVGHSRGGGVSLLTAAAGTGRVSGVIVYEPTVPLGMGPLSRGPGGRPADLTSRLVGRALERRSTFPDREAMYLHFRDRGAFKGWRDDFLRAYVTHGAVEAEGGGVELACPPRVEALLYEAMFDVTEWSKIDRCEVPVLAVYGERGGRVGEGRDPTAPIRGMFPRTETLVLTDCTHSGPMEHPELMEEAIRQFAARTS